VKVVQLGGLVVREKRRDERIARRLDRPVGDAEDQVAAKRLQKFQAKMVSRMPARWPTKANPTIRPEADEVAERTAEDHRERESPEARGR
jgi:hypothetical protein